MNWLYFALGVSAAFNVIGGIAIWLILFHEVRLDSKQKAELIEKLEADD